MEKLLLNIITFSYERSAVRFSPFPDNPIFGIIACTFSTISIALKLLQHQIKIGKKMQIIDSILSVSGVLIH